MSLMTGSGSTMHLAKCIHYTVQQGVWPLYLYIWPLSLYIYGHCLYIYGHRLYIFGHCLSTLSSQQTNKQLALCRLPALWFWRGLLCFLQKFAGALAALFPNRCVPPSLTVLLLYLTPVFSLRVRVRWHSVLVSIFMWRLLVVSCQLVWISVFLFSCSVL